LTLLYDIELTWKKGHFVMDWVQTAVIVVVIIVCVLFLAFVGKKYLK